ncbi:SET domain-containing protein [Zunongwangia sp. F363]|uniref:SET domain-containing protein n=1 Tax=Autumnicola tepida TaxID=3075595 RepID=A0ABU3C9X1_9FLAO|nr:SET domain-containing protein [Zunongwangia sp. F363]MDT0643124.1 SET domain-containing protein [Zunongwangia sp. F363]
MMHPDTEIRFISEEIGYGVVALRRIPKGTITWVQDELDQIYTPEEVGEMSEFARQMIDKYTFRNNKGNFVLCWDTAKYVNHSFRSNCLSTAYDFEIAVRDIREGEELTDDYGYLNVTEAFRAKDENTERKVVYPNDLEKFYPLWDRQLQQAFGHINSVPQPLRAIIPAEIQKEVLLVIKGKKEMKSILHCYYNED